MEEHGILSAIGNTPTIKLSKIFSENHFELFAKLEFLNPGGSIKDRPAFNIIKNALENGEINRETTIIESSSGNMGIGIAQICNYLGLKFICVVDLKTNKQTVDLLTLYGAEVIIIKESIDGEYLKSRINKVKMLTKSIKNSYWCNQYSNLNNSNSHYQTMNEIFKSIGDKIDYLFIAVSTCGTLRGCSEYIKKHNYSTKIIAVDAKGSIIFSNEKFRRLIPGHGAARKPELYKPELNDSVIHVTDIDCIIGCRQLLRKESLLVGGSSGGIIYAVRRIKKKIPEGSVCLVIFPDGGVRYLDTIFSDN